MPSASRSGWGRTGHRRAVLIGALAFALVVGGGVAAWAEVSGGTTGYRMATVTRADIGTTLTIVGNVEPVSDAAPSFQVAGKVATVNVTPGAQVTAGETLGTLDTTALSETVSSAQSTLSSDEAKLAEDEANESASTPSSSNGSNSTTSTSPSSTTTTTAPGRTGGTPSGGGQSATVTADQNKLTQDQSTLSLAQQQEAADLAQAQSDCTSANTSTPTGQAACETALQTVSADEQQVSKDQTTVSKDEATLAQALTAESSSGGGATGNSGSSPTAHAVAADPTSTGNTGSGGSGGTGSTASNSRDASSSTGSSSTSANTDTPEQIASDQAAIDTAEANLTEAEQSLKEATLTTPINGTVVSVGITAGDTVSAGSSTAIITIVGTKSYEAQATLDSSQIPTVKVGQTATAQVDGVDGTIQGTVSQVGPVQSTSSGFTYPVVVALPDSVAGLYAGSTANVNVSTGSVSNVLAVPTSAVQTVGSGSYVTELENGQLTRKVIKVGMVGDVYTEVDSGLSAGQSVVLVDYAEPVPSSNTNTTGGLGGFLGGGAGGFPGGGGTFNFQRVGTGGGGGPKLGG
ncbi:MAG TPA: efflux RND transporter periplasmic adaptor subunit [Acidimicrobiales bacterium]|nr:efflux RND transporter periplasmic adaptor subunit [Acidimicrobiales bacterium]